MAGSEGPLASVELWTDGSGSVGDGGWAYVLRWGDREAVGTGYVPETTNQRMEMTALLMGLRALRRPCRVIVHTDSAYVMRAFTERWLERWRRTGWIAGSGSKRHPVVNRDLWEALLEASRGHDLAFVKVRGHTGVLLNERCDELAGQARRDRAPLVAIATPSPEQVALVL